jgi:hypothetical protein
LGRMMKRFTVREEGYGGIYSWGRRIGGHLQLGKKDRGIYRLGKND